MILSGMSVIYCLPTLILPTARRKAIKQYIIPDFHLNLRANEDILPSSMSLSLSSSPKPTAATCFIGKQAQISCALQSNYFPFFFSSLMNTFSWPFMWSPNRSFNIQMNWLQVSAQHPQQSISFFILNFHAWRLFQTKAVIQLSS